MQRERRSEASPVIIGPASTGGAMVHRWFEQITMSVVLGMAAFGLVALCAAMVGHATPAVVASLGVVAWAVLAFLWRPGRFRPPARTVRVWVLVAGLLIVVSATVVNLRFQGQYVLTDRDPGIYSNGGAWIAQHGNLVVQSRPGALDGVQGLQVTALGQKTLAGNDTRLEIQGAHLFPVLLAIGYWIGGAHGLFAVPAILGGVSLAVVFVVGLRFLPDWIALTAMTALAVNFGWIYTVRSVLSEPLMLIFAFSGLLFTAHALADPRWRRLLVAGFVVAGSLAARLDAGVAVLLLLPAVAFLIGRDHRQAIGGRPDPWGRLTWFAAGWIIPATLSFTDLEKFSPYYVFYHRSEFLAVQFGLIAAVLAAVATMAVSVLSVNRTQGLLGRAAVIWRVHAPSVAVLSAALVVLVAAFSWWLRPILWHTAAPAGPGKVVMEAIQKRDGLPLDGNRTYDEITLVEVAWYLGPLVVVGAVLAIAVMVKRLAIGRLPTDLGLLLALVVPISTLYLYRTAIYPDQPWAIRRFVPVTLPGFLLLAGWLGAWLVERSSTFGLLRSGIYRRGAFLAVVAVALLPPLFVTWPLKAASWEAGGVSGIQRLCDAIGPDGVAVLSAEIGRVVLPAVRGFCAPDVGAVAVSDPTRKNVIDAPSLAGRVAAGGRKLMIVASNKAAVLLLAPTAKDVRAIPILNTTEVVSTLERPPAVTGPRVLTLWVGEVPVE